ncbi:hypothetical protein EG878_16580, partial [Enterococcus faecalis]
LEQRRHAYPHGVGTLGVGMHAVRQIAHQGVVRGVAAVRAVFDVVDIARVGGGLGLQVIAHRPRHQRTLARRHGMEDDLDAVRYAQGDEGVVLRLPGGLRQAGSVGADANQRRGRRFCAHASRPAIDDILDSGAGDSAVAHHRPGRACQGKSPEVAADAEGLVGDAVALQNEVTRQAGDDSGPDGAAGGAGVGVVHGGARRVGSVVGLEGQGAGGEAGGGVAVVDGLRRGEGGPEKEVPGRAGVEDAIFDYRAPVGRGGREGDGGVVGDGAAGARAGRGAAGGLGAGPVGQGRRDGHPGIRAAGDFGAAGGVVSGSGGEGDVDGGRSGVGLAPENVVDELVFQVIRHGAGGSRPGKQAADQGDGGKHQGSEGGAKGFHGVPHGVVLAKGTVASRPSCRGCADSRAT